jgi:hypothetical protein
MPQPYSDQTKKSGRAEPQHRPDAKAGPWVPAMTSLNLNMNDIAPTLAAMHREWTEFVSRRLAEDLALPQRMAACHRPDEVWQVWGSFLQRAFADYHDELGALARLGSSEADRPN